MQITDSQSFGYAEPSLYTREGDLCYKLDFLLMQCEEILFEMK